LIRDGAFVFGRGGTMKRIELTQGKYATVDDVDYEKVSQHKWWAQQSNLSDHLWYAMTKIDTQVVSLHRFLMECPKGEVDHKDGDGLNNRRANLREVTKTQQRMNQKRFKNNQSGFKGVRWEANKWRARIGVNNKHIHLGRFENKLDAAKAYNDAAQKYFGQYARLNAL
jgi:hypothetical protein